MTSTFFLLWLLSDSAEHPGGSFVFFFDRYGLPVGFLSIIVWGAIRGARWLAPRIDRLINRHESLLDALEKELRQHGMLLDNLLDNQSRVLDILVEMRRSSEAATLAAEKAAAAAEAIRVERASEAMRVERAQH